MVTPRLDEVLITEELVRRPSRTPDYKAEADAAAQLAVALADPAGDALQALADTVVAMGVAESAGVSLQIDEDDGPRCFWRAVAGRWRERIGTSLPLDQTPCGVTIERNAVALFAAPDRVFPALAMAPRVHEMLLAPLGGGGAAGTVWAVSHDAARAFEQEDVRLLRRLAALAAAAHRLEGAVREAEEQRARTATALDQTRSWLRQLVEGVPLLLWRASDDGRWIWASPQWARLTGRDAVASLGQGWLDAVHPDDRRRARRAWRLARGAEAYEAEYRIYDRDAGRYRWFQARATPVRDAGGAIVEWLGTSTDVDDLENLREHQRLLLAELQHRVRNTLAVVRSIARRTAERSDGMDDFLMHFEGRLSAFARSQSLVTRDAGGKVDLEMLVAEELLAHQAHEGDRVTITGPPVQLPTKVADALGLAIHELAVNALKYGGLSGENGRVAVCWELDGSPAQPTLALTWVDSSPDRSAAPPSHEGFGSELIRRSLVYDLDAETDLAIGSGGARCEIRVPLGGRWASQT